MLTLHVDAAPWRAHMKSTAAEYPALVPVAKGNGYGFGNARLATEAAQLGADTIAVGTLTEVADMTRVGDFSSILVLTPWYPGEPSDIATPPAVVRTVASLEGLEGLRGARVVLECLTSLRRHGIAYTDLGEIARLVDRVRIEGWAMHLPIDRFPGTDPVREVAQWVAPLQPGALPLATVYVSPLPAAEIARLSSRFPEVTFRARVGTQLWLGDPSFFDAPGTLYRAVRRVRWVCAAY